MKKPDVLTKFYDEAHNMTYHVWAYRALTELEMIQAVGLYLSQPKKLRRKERERNKTVTTNSLMGSEIAIAFGR